MFQHKNLEKCIYFLIYFIPFSIFIGVSILNINCVLVSLLILFYIFKSNKFDIFFNKNNYFFILLLFLFLISTTISNYKIQSIENFFSFFLQLTLFIGLIYFLKKDKKKCLNLSKIIFFIVLIVCFDLWIQRLFGQNILGFSQQQAGRLTSFFKDEQIPGGVIFKLSPFFIYFLFKQRDYFLLIKIKYMLIIFLYFSILITGERLSSLLATSALIIIFAMNLKNIKLSKLAIYSAIFISFFSFLYFQEDSIIAERISYTFSQLDQNVYFFMFRNAFEIFKDNIFFGTGLQTYRFECHLLFQNCSTHPHNFFLELLSDTGIFGVLTFYICLIIMVYRKIKYVKNNILSRSIILSYTLLLFFPLLPSGSFFNSFGMNITWFSLGFIYTLDNDL